MIDILDTLKKLIDSSGFAQLFNNPLPLVMIAVSCLLIYLAIVKKFEPLLLLPIAFGMLLTNLPLGGLMDEPTYIYLFDSVYHAKAGSAVLLPTDTVVGMAQALNLTVTQLSEGMTITAEMLQPLNGTVASLVNTSGVTVALTEGMTVTAEFLSQFASPIYLLNGVITGATTTVYQYVETSGGLLYYLYQGVKLGIYPPLIFLGVGAMTDFGPLIANPKSLLLGAAAQLGIFIVYIIARLIGFTQAESGSIGIIGGADGPTAIYLTGKLAPHLLGPIAVAAYSYMALIPMIQKPIMRALTTKEERAIVMDQLRPVSKTEKIIFPIVVTLVVSLMLPSAAPLIGMLMLGNLLKESGVTERLSKMAQNELMNIVTIFLGVTVGATAKAETFLTLQTLEIIVIGVFAFAMGTAGGLLLGKLMCKLTHGKVNPLIGSAGVSAVPMAARVSNQVGQEENPGNFLLMHAMGPNVAGVIGSALAAGVLLSMFG